MAKMNKTESWDTIKAMVSNVAHESSTLKKGQADLLIEEMTAQLAPYFQPTTGGGTSTKINADGDVFCNYYGDYLPANHFNTKLNKKGEDTYKANSIEAEQILRKIKSVATKMEKLLIAGLRDGSMGETEVREYEQYEKTLKGEKYTTVSDVPTLADLMGLGTGEELGDIKPTRPSK